MQSVVVADPFTTAPRRVLGYAYAVGVALRYRFCQDLKNVCSVVAATFIVCHTLYRGLTDEGPVAISMLDTLIFESLASLAVPSLTTYSVCRATRNYIKGKTDVPKWFARLLPTALGLAVLPLLCRSLDGRIIKLMSQTLRPLYMN